VGAEPALALIAARAASGCEQIDHSAIAQGTVGLTAGVNIFQVVAISHFSKKPVAFSSKTAVKYRYVPALTRCIVRYQSSSNIY
jgi:hypothetical protein